MEQDDPELTEEQISLINQLNNSELKIIDDDLLSNISNQWRKLARVIASTMMVMDKRVKVYQTCFMLRELNC